MTEFNLFDLSLVLPELVMVMSALILLLVGAFRGSKSTLLVASCSIFVLLSVMSLLYQHTQISGVTYGFNNLFRLDGFIIYSKMLVIGAAAVVLFLFLGLQQSQCYKYEFPVLVLLSTTGMMVMLSANDFITLYMGLELQSLVIYVLAAFERDNSKSAEAGLKYFILGSVASGIMLYGISLIYGFSGTTNFNAIFMLYTQNAVMPIAVIIGLVMVLTALCFKISAAPFHMWTPDVYEGAPTIAVTFFATSAKVASSLLLIRFLMEPFAMAMDKWQQIIIFISIISMIIGAVSAIWQSNFKRLIAYSAITHIGYLLIGVATGNMAGIHAVLIYLLIYVITTLGIFALILMMTDRGAQNGAISALKGLNKSNPYTAFAIVVLMLSLSGIPPLAGFFGKFYLFIAALRSELYLLAATGIITSVIGSYYYLKIIRVMYFEEADAQHAPIQMNVLVINIVIMISVIFNLSFFLAPDLIIRTALAVASVLVQ